MNTIKIGAIEGGVDGNLYLRRSPIQKVNYKELSTTNQDNTIEGTITFPVNWLIKELGVLRCLTYPDVFVHQIILTPFDIFNHQLTKLGSKLFGNSKRHADPVVVNSPNSALVHRYTRRVTQSSILQNCSFYNNNGNVTNLTLEPAFKSDNKGNWGIDIPCILCLQGEIVSVRVKLDDWMDFVNNTFVENSERSNKFKIKRKNTRRV